MRPALRHKSEPTWRRCVGDPLRASMGVESFEGAELCSVDSRVAARRRCGRVCRAGKVCGIRHDDRRPLCW